LSLMGQSRRKLKPRSKSYLRIILVRESEFRIIFGALKFTCRQM
jgi:hypothetical protein